MSGIQAPPPSAGVLGQGVKYPLTLTANGRLALSWGADSVGDSIQSIMRTQPHERPMLPGYGAGSGTFEPIADSARTKLAAEKSISDNEPRVDRLEIDVQVQARGEQYMRVEYTVIGEASPRTLTFPLFTGPAVTAANK